MLTLLAIICGFALDFIFGDPHSLPHPIILIGNLIGFLEKKSRQFFEGDDSLMLFSGFVLVLIVLILTFGIPYIILYFAQKINPWLAFILQVLMFYQIFATRCLKDESMEVYKPLIAGDLPMARKRLSWIVGRDTEKLTEEEVTKATVETIAENTADGTIAPMLYMFIGGAPLAFLYKGINTMDSMIGYKNEKYLYIGRCAAKLDDAANFIPSRLAAGFMIVATYLLHLDYALAWRIFKRDRYNHLSPNSAQTESVVAGALGVQLGGGHFYFNEFVPKQTIGDNLRVILPRDIIITNKILYYTSFVAIIVFALCRVIYLKF
ncbi:Cobalamin biosynthesis protein CobD [bioreactor metagenome]|uniref:Cobalamin biosynthesis protein CobD n=1 Tax=bioreactor metagenome TaxID=1076179 RepID=A0A644TJK0_9ZZZZ|nr:adenosylcobinamide-phosphate synthase CbiB [Acidaminococcaceae bacterium]